VRNSFVWLIGRLRVCWREWAKDQYTHWYNSRLDIASLGVKSNAKLYMRKLLPGTREWYKLLYIEMYGEQREPRWIFPNLRYFAKFYQADRYTVGKRCYINAFKRKIIQIALKYRQFCSFKVVHAGIIFYRHGGMTTQFLVCFPILYGSRI
jgi:hypothetical protein